MNRYELQTLQAFDRSILAMEISLDRLNCLKRQIKEMKEIVNTNTVFANMKIKGDKS